MRGMPRPLIRMSFLCQTRYLASLLHSHDSPSCFAMFAEPHSSSVVYGVGMIKSPLECLIQ